MKNNKMPSIQNASIWFKALLMNLIVFIVSQVFFQPTFETCDDNYMAAIVYGAYGEYESKLICINELMGKLMRVLLNFFPAVPWYSIIQYLCIFAAFTVILFVILKREKNEYRFVLAWIFLITFGYECYVKIQFSKTGGILTIAGVLLIYEAINQKKIHISYLGIGAILTVLGSMWRFNVFCMVLPIIGSIALFQGMGYVKKKKYKEFGRFAIVFGAVFISCFLLKFYDVHVYESESDWDKYITFEKARVQLLDYGFPDYLENRNVYQELGISQNDLEIYRYWNYADPDLFTVERIRQLASAKPESRLNLDVLRSFFEQYPVRFLRYPYFGTFLIIFVLWIICSRKNKHSVLFALLVGVGIEIYFFCVGRYFISRIDVSIFMSLCIAMIQQIEKTHYDGLNKYVIAAVAGGIMLNGSSFLNDMALPKTNREKEEAQEVFNLINEDKGHFYLMENYTSDDLWTTAYSVWDIPPKGLNSNCYVTGGWRYNTPLTNKVKDSYGMDNPYRDIVNNSNAYIVNDYSMQSMLKYIQEHYYPTAKANLVKEINGHRFYQITTKELKLDVSEAAEFGEDVAYDVSVTYDESGTQNLEGYVYKEGTNSYYQKVYIGEKDVSQEEESYVVASGTERSWNDDRGSKYSWFRLPLSELKIYNEEDIEKSEITIYLEINGELYKKRIDLKETLEERLVKDDQ